MNNIADKLKKLKEEKIKVMQEGSYTNPQQYPSPYENLLTGQNYYPVSPSYQSFLSAQQNMQFAPINRPQAPVYNDSLNPSTYVNPPQFTPLNSPINGQISSGVFSENINTASMPSDVLNNSQTVTSTTPVNDNTNVRNVLFNPYSGVNIEGALFNLGRSLNYSGDQPGWNTVRGIASAGKVGLGGARTLLAGFANQNATQDTYNSFIDRLYNTAPVYMQEGGVTNAAVATGSYVVETPLDNTAGMTPVELEKNEIVQDMATGQIAKVAGETHENGGVKTELPPSKVLSDHTKVGAKNAKYFREEFDMKVKATDTFANVMDKYNNKIGWNNLVEEEEKVITEIGNQEQSSISNDTKDINLNYLSNRLQDIQLEKDTSVPIQDEAFNKIFDRQEQIPKKREIDKMREGGIYDANIMQLSETYGVSPERVYEMLQNLQQPPMMQAGGFTFFQPSDFSQPPYTYQPFIPGTTNAAGLENEAQVLQRLEAQNRALPYLVRDSGIFSDNAGAFPNLNNTSRFQQAYDNYVNATVVEIDNNPYLTQAEKDAAKTTATGQLLGISNRDGQYDNIYGKETSSRTNFNLPYLTTEDRKKYSDLRFLGDVIDTETGKIKDNYKDLDQKTQELILQTYGRGKNNSLNIGLGVIPTQEAVSENVTPQQTNPVRDVVQYSNANVPVDFLLPPTGAQPVYRQQANLSRLDPVKQTAEPQLANIDSQMNTAIAALSGLPEAQRAAAIANLLGTSQQASNQAIGQVEAANTQNQAQISQYNAQQADKEQLLNFQLDNDYQNRVFATLNNTQTDIRRYFQDLNNQNNFLFNYVDRRNLLNQMTPNYYNNGSGLVQFQDANGNIFSSGVAPTSTRRTPEQQAVYLKELARRQAIRDSQR